jgi:hypothetical protein
MKESLELWPIALAAAALAFHYFLASRRRNLPFSPMDSSHALSYRLNKPLFFKGFNVVLRLTLRGIDKLAKCFGCLGFSHVEKVLKDYSLALFMFCLRHLNPSAFAALKRIPTYEEHLAQQAEIARKEAEQNAIPPSTENTCRDCIIPKRYEGL